MQPHEHNLEEWVEKKKESVKETVKNVKANILEVQDKMVKHHRKRNVGKALKVGMKVLRVNARKTSRQGGGLEQDFYGPYIIVELRQKTARLKNIKTDTVLMRKYSIDHLKAYREDGDRKDAGNEGTADTRDLGDRKEAESGDGKDAGNEGTAHTRDLGDRIN